MRFDKILCPIDFSSGSQQALHTAVRLSSESGAELVLLHAWYLPPLAFASELPPMTIQDLYDDAERSLAKAVVTATELGAKRVSSKLASGMPWAIITEAAMDCDLVVIGTHGRTGVARFLLGSVAEKVVRHAACSVLAVRPEGEVGRFAHALCPTDFSESAHRALELAATVVAGPNASVTLLHVLEVPVEFITLPMPAMYRAADRDVADSLEQEARELLSTTKLRVTPQSRIGAPGTEILNALDADPSIDLVVMGSHGRTGIKRALLGSVAEKIVRHARCPVLVARPKA